MEGRGALIVLAAIHRETELVCSHRTTKSLPALVVLALENRPLGLDRDSTEGRVTKRSSSISAFPMAALPRLWPSLSFFCHDQPCFQMPTAST
jgi:hypothetical protein